MSIRGFLTFLLTVLLMSVHLLSQPLVVKIWPAGAPGARSHPRYREDTVLAENGAPRIRRVTDPLLYIYRADGEHRPAVLIFPGGAYRRLSMDHEGHDAARWLTSIGMTAVVVKYRLPSDTIMTEKSIGPLQDAQEAMRIVRRNAVEWKLDPDRIGVMGFSAGGHLASSLSTLYAYRTYEPADGTSARPDFSLLIYPVISMEERLTHAVSRTNLLGASPSEQSVELFSEDLQVSDKTPPAFLVHAADDNSVPPANSIRYYEALRTHGIPAELHVYQSGGHGFGLGSPGGAESAWPEACRLWLKVRGILRD